MKKILISLVTGILLSNYAFADTMTIYDCEDEISDKIFEALPDDYFHIEFPDEMLIEDRELVKIEISTQIKNKKSIYDKCLLEGKYHFENNQFEDASRSYIFSNEFDKSIESAKKSIKNDIQTSAYINLAHSYVLKGDINRAKKEYQNYLKFHGGNGKKIRNDFALLKKLYPKKLKTINEAQNYWNKLYKPLEEANKLYESYFQLENSKTEPSVLFNEIQLTLEKHIPNSFFRMEILSELAILDKSKSIEYLEKQLVILENIYDLKNEKNLSKYKEIVRKIGIKHSSISLKYYNKILTLEKEIFGDKHINIANTYSDIAFTFIQMDDNIKAIKFYKKQVAILENILDYEKIEILKVYHSIALYSDIMKNYQEALDFRKKETALTEKIYGLDHISTSRSYKELANAYYKVGKDKEALEYRKKEIALTENIYGLNHEDTATVYNKLGNEYNYLREFKKSLEYLYKAMLINEKIFGIDNEKTILIYSNIANTYRNSGDYKKSLEFYNKTLTVNQKLFGVEHQKIAAVYGNIGNVYQDLGDYNKSLEYLNKALVINERISDRKRLGELSSNYSSIGLTYIFLDNYKEALEYLSKALDLKEKELGYKTIYDPLVSVIYNNLGALYSNLGDYDKALEYNTKALNIREEKFDTYLKRNNKTLDIREKEIGVESESTADSYNNVASTYINLEDYNKALKYNNKALAINEKIFGLNHITIAPIYSTLGDIYTKLKDYNKALDYYNKALIIREKILGVEHPDTAKSYSKFASIHNSLKNYNKALEFYGKAIKINEKVLGIEHRNTYYSYNNIAETYNNLKDYKNSYSYTKKAFDIFLKNRDKNFDILDSKQKEMYLSSNSDVNLYFIRAYDYKSSDNNIFNEISIETFDRWINTKGSIYDSENAIVTLYEKTDDKNLKKLIENLNSSKVQLAKLYQSPPFDEYEINSYKTQVKNFEDTISNLEKVLSNHASVFQEELGLKNINYKDISKNLKDGELYIDFANIDNEYLIFTLDNKNSINFEKISKEDFKIIEDSINEFRDINERFSNTAKGLDSKKISDLTIESKDKSSLIYDKLLNSSISIKNALNSADSLIISADGILRLLPFEALYDKNSSKYLIEDKNIRYIPSGKEFVRLYSNSIKNNEKQNNKISMFANPNFNDKNTKEKEDNNSEKLLTPNTSRSVAAEALFSMEQFSVLPNTKIEAINIKNILSNYKVDEYLENNASESNLFNISKPKILHIATHGFFINDNDIPNPMLKSGIVLSGANQSLKYSKDEGIVTSLKLSSLDLKSTQLVVLSACQTAEVDPNSSESVSGLNKAFIQAGANSVIMSLWAVADKETMELMSNLYNNIKDNKSYSLSLRNSKLGMIKQNIHPYYWAPFIISGRD